MYREEVFPQTASLQGIGIYDTSQRLRIWLVSCIPPRYLSNRTAKLIPFNLSKGKYHIFQFEGLSVCQWALFKAISMSSNCKKIEIGYIFFCKTDFYLIFHKI